MCVVYVWLVRLAVISRSVVHLSFVLVSGEMCLRGRQGPRPGRPAEYTQISNNRESEGPARGGGRWERCHCQGDGCGRIVVGVPEVIPTPGLTATKAVRGV